MATLSTPPTRAGRYVTFQISRQYFALEAGLVRQVTPARDTLPYDHPLNFVRGVLVVKGRRVPVVDIRARLAVKPGPSRPNATVLLVEMREITGLPMLGILADRMTDVCDFRERDFREHVIQQRPHGKPYGRPKTLLTLEKMFSPDEIAELKSIF